MVECFKYIKGRANRENLDKMMFEYEQEKSEILNSPLQALIQETLVSLLDHGMNLQSKRGENMIDFL